MRNRGQDSQRLVDALGDTATSLVDVGDPYAPLLRDLDEARVVLIGEASHGTADFYRLRAELTQRLIEEKGFSAVAVEGDWPDCFRANRWVRCLSDDHSAADALGGFRRFPGWMWRNTEAMAFLEWLRAYNENRAEPQRAGFYGLDLYSLHASMDAVVAYLERVDPPEARRARDRYRCFEPHGPDPQSYGSATTFGLSPNCEREVLEQLVSLHKASGRYLGRDGFRTEEDYFAAEQNARTVKSAERYYRSMFSSVGSWNLRDTHMADTLEALLRHLSRGGPPAKVVVWAHNSHVGDARATELGHQGELNLGQLARERYGAGTYLLGLTTHHGWVTAATEWGGEPERKRVRPSLAGSYEALFHQTGLSRFYLSLDDLGEVGAGLREERLHRAIGVIYRPETERRSHYFHVNLCEQFDAVVHLDETSALVPLERTSLWEEGEAPETYPTGM